MGEWKQGLCSCFSNITLCCMANIMMPLAIGKNAAAIGDAHPYLWPMAFLCPCVTGGVLRMLIRQKYGIEGSLSGDCCTWLICGECALVQETAQTGSMDYCLPPDQESMKRVAPENN